MSHRTHAFIASAASLAMAISLTVAPAVRAQAASPVASPAASPSAEPTPAPTAFCSVLAAPEVTKALGVDVVVGDSSDTDCTYQTDSATGQFTSLNARYESGSIDQGPRLLFPDAKGVQVAGHLALLASDGVTDRAEPAADDQVKPGHPSGLG